MRDHRWSPGWLSQAKATKVAVGGRFGLLGRLGRLGKRGLHYATGDIFKNPTWGGVGSALGSAGLYTGGSAVGGSLASRLVGGAQADDGYDDWYDETGFYSPRDQYGNPIMYAGRAKDPELERQLQMWEQDPALQPMAQQYRSMLVDGVLPPSATVADEQPEPSTWQGQLGKHMDGGVTPTEPSTSVATSEPSAPKQPRSRSAGLSHQMYWGVPSNQIQTSKGVASPSVTPTDRPQVPAFLKPQKPAEPMKPEPIKPQTMLAAKPPKPQTPMQPTTSATV